MGFDEIERLVVWRDHEAVGPFGVGGCEDPGDLPVRVQTIYRRHAGRVLRFRGSLRHGIGSGVSEVQAALRIDCDVVGSVELLSFEARRHYLYFSCLHVRPRQARVVALHV